MVNKEHRNAQACHERLKAIIVRNKVCIYEQKVLFTYRTSKKKATQKR